MVGLNKGKMEEIDKLIAEAKQRYPIGCTIKSNFGKIIKIESHTFNASLSVSKDFLFVYYNNCKVSIRDRKGWAEVVEPLTKIDYMEIRPTDSIKVNFNVEMIDSPNSTGHQYSRLLKSKKKLNKFIRI